MILYISALFDFISSFFCIRVLVLGTGSGRGGIERVPLLLRVNQRDYFVDRSLSLSILLYNRDNLM
jgi:hypothetical protein